MKNIINFWKKRATLRLRRTKDNRQRVGAPDEATLKLRQDYKTTSGAVAETTDLRNHGITDRAKPAQGSQPFYTFYTLSTIKYYNITTTLQKDNGLQTTDYGRGGSRNYGITESRKLSFALLRQDNETLASPDNRQRTTVGAAAGTADLRNHGSTELWNYGSFAKTTRPWLRQTTRQRVNETTSRAPATCSLVVL